MEVSEFFEEEKFLKNHTGIGKKQLSLQNENKQKLKELGYEKLDDFDIDCSGHSSFTAEINIEKYIEQHKNHDFKILKTNNGYCLKDVCVSFNNNDVHSEGLLRIKINHEENHKCIKNDKQYDKIDEFINCIKKELEEYSESIQEYEDLMTDFIEEDFKNQKIIMEEK